MLTTDTIVQGIHFLGTDAPTDVAWKLVAVNLSDLAAKGATPEGVLLNYPLAPSPGKKGGWDAAFVSGLHGALTHFACPLFGGDTVSLGADVPRVITLTAIGRATDAPFRSGAQAGDALYVTGTIGDAGAGLQIARGAPGPAGLLAAYRRPQPRLSEGRVLAPVAHAMMDVSDGLLIDAARMAAASELSAEIDLSMIPLSAEYRAFAGDDRSARLAAATAGDDYELLLAAPADAVLPVAATRVGTFTAPSAPAKSGAQGPMGDARTAELLLSREHMLSLTDSGVPIPLPERLGFTHGA